MLSLNVKAQQQEEAKTLTFEIFLQEVLANNLEFIIEKYEVDIAEAALIASRVFEDPELEVIFPTFVGDEFNAMPRNIAFELEVPIELFGKRRNRIRVAEAERVAATHDLEDFLRHLRADAAEVFSSVLIHKLLLERMQLTKTQLQELLEAIQFAYEVGEVGEIEVVHTRLEKRGFEAEIIDTQVELSELLSEAYFLMGGIPIDSLVFSGELKPLDRLLNYETLVESALKNRPDIQAAESMLNAAEFERRLARSERLPDLAIIAGYHNEEALRPMPGFDVAYVGFRIPLQFSGLNRGAYVESLRRLDQAEAESKLVKLEAENEIKLAWNKLQLLNQKRTIYTESILLDSERVRDAAVFSYQMGAASLLEVLDAQRTMNETFESYYETLEEYTHILIELSKNTGEWFVEF